MELVKFDKYMDQLQEEFKDVSLKSLRDVVKHGFEMLTVYNRYDQDIHLKNDRRGLYYYFGTITHTLAERIELSNKKRLRKFRLVHRIKTKGVHDGYYYFGLNDKQYEEHLANKPIAKVYMFRVQKEIGTDQSRKHYFKVKIEDQDRFVLSMIDYDTSKAEFMFSKVNKNETNNK